jgi:tetratricopeptide (TPR) repeat protein
VRLLVVAVALLTLCCPLVIAGDDAAAAFDTGLRRVANLMADKQWPAAEDELLALLEEHGDASYARFRTTELRGDLEACAFWSQHDEPPLSDLVAGELLSYNSKTGRIKLRYTRDVTARPSASSESDELVSAVTKLLDGLGKGMPPIGDFFGNGSTSIHPIHFVGPYSIEIKGTMPTEDEFVVPTIDSAQIFVCMQPSGLHNVVFGAPPLKSLVRSHAVPARVYEARAGSIGRTVLARSDDTKLKLGRSYTCKVSVTRSQIKVAFNGRTFLKADKSGDVFGQVGFAGWMGLEQITIDGEANTAWIDGLIDAHIQKEWSTFEQAFVYPEGAPEWIQQAADSDADVGRPTLEASPASNDATREHLAKLIELRDESQYQEALDYLDGLAVDAVTPCFREYCAGLLEARLGRTSHAVKRCDGAMESAPEFVAARVLHAQLLRSSGRSDDAILELRSLISESASMAGPYEELARQQLSAGDVVAARATIEGAIDAAVPPQNLERVHSVLRRAEQGPQWRSVHENRSKNFHVLSNLNKKLCKEAIRILEDQRDLYVDMFGQVDSDEPLRVFLFSGQAGYLAYAEDLLGDQPDGTAGLYSPILKQLLVWNLPNHDEMRATIRHEGFHQYFDQRLPGAPLWLNEGLAEYFEFVEMKRGRPLPGIPAQQHVLSLLDWQTKWLDVAQLTTMGHGEFYGSTANTQAQSWALVHWLLTTGPEHSDRFWKYLEAIEGGDSVESAASLILAGDSEKKLLAKLKKHVASLKQR